MNANTDSALTRLLQPLAVDSFFNTYWEKSPVHIERNELEKNTEQYFSDILSIDAIDTLLSSGDLYFPDVQLIKQPDTISADQYTNSDKRILPLRLIEHYTAGATLTVARADTKIATLGAYCRQLQSEWQMTSHANLYLSPPGHQGFKPHYDSHDVFIIQVSGTKQFNFYTNNVELPFNEDRFDADSFEPGEQTDQLTLTPGDTLYIPRGITHDAIAHDQSPSLHITLGVYPVTVRDLLQDLIQVAADTDVRFRQSMPLMETPTSDNEQAVISPNNEKLLTTLISRVATKEHIDRTLAMYQQQIALECRQDSRGVLTSQHVSHPLTETSVIDVRTGMVFGIDTSTINGGTETTVRSPGQIIEFHEPMGSAARWILEQQSTTIGEIPALDTEQKFALVDRLHRQNIISLRS